MTIREWEQSQGWCQPQTKYEGGKLYDTFVFSADSGWHYAYARVWQYDRLWPIKIGKSRNWVKAVEMMQAWEAWYHQTHGMFKRRNS